MSATETSATTAAPNSTVGASEVSGVVPDQAGQTSTSPSAAAHVEEIPPSSVEPSKTSVPPPAPIQQLWLVAKAHAHPEIWGVTLADPESHVPSQIVLQKYLNANDGDVVKAKDQLTKTLDWRAQQKPLNLLKKAYSKAKFEGLGFVTLYGEKESSDPEMKEVFTWNVYGGVKSMDETFGQLNDFIEWRIALMEQALHSLSISTATKPITETYDPYKIFQVHDYKSISFMRQSLSVKAASTETIKVFAQNYPELLKEKFFINVPAIMGFVYAFMKLFVAAKTVKKFHPMSNGAALAQEFGQSRVKGLGEMLPEQYGGKGGDLRTTGQEPKLE